MSFSNGGSELIVLLFSVHMLQSLLNAGVPIDVKDSSEAGNTLLHWACSYSTAEVVRMLCGMEMT